MLVSYIIRFDTLEELMEVITSNDENGEDFLRNTRDTYSEFDVEYFVIPSEENYYGIEILVYDKK